MTKTEAARVVNARVRVGKGGQGVLVPGGFILTAAHCIRWNGEGGMALGDYYIENITTKSGTHLRVGPVAADPVSDIAVLGALDNQTFFDDVEAFEQWCEVTKPVPLMMKILPHGKPLGVRILSHRGNCIKGKVTNYGFGPVSSGRMCIEAVSQIEGGTSGGPVVDSDGRLVAVISNSVEVHAGEKCVGALPIVCLALPRWILLRVSQAQRKAKGPQNKP